VIKVFRVIAVLLLAAVMFMSGFVLLAKHTFNRKDCIRFNIDNIEVRTGINVPSVTDCDCEATQSDKLSTFIIDTTHTNLATYIVKNDFEKGDNYYFKEGQNDKTIWKARLDTETAELRFNIHYLK
jgi:hypothetical protein